MKRLGHIGRWGNTLFQYLFIRSYALNYGLDYQCPPWAGQYLFGLSDPPVTANLPRYVEKRFWHIHHWSSIAPDGGECHDRDVEAYFQWHTSYYAPWRDQAQDWFTCRGPMADRLAPATEEFLKHRTRIGIHLRRGDTGRAIFYLTPTAWYLQWLEENWPKFEDPILYVASEDPSLVQEFSGYPIAATVQLTMKKVPHYVYLPYDLRRPTPVSMDFFPDWYFLTLCDVILMGNSTFSFTAGMFSKVNPQVYRSRLSTQSFDRIYPWDCTPLTYEHLKDYPDIPGTSITGSPYWR